MCRKGVCEIEARKTRGQRKGLVSGWAGPKDVVNGHISKRIGTCCFGIGALEKERKEKGYDVSAKQRHSDTAHAH